MSNWLKRPVFWFVITPFLLLGAVFLINPMLTKASFCPLPTWFEASHGPFPPILSSWYVYVIIIIFSEIVLGYFWLLVSGLWLKATTNDNDSANRRLFLSLPLTATLASAGIGVGGALLLNQFADFELKEILMLVLLLLCGLIILGSLIWLFVVSIIQYNSEGEQHELWKGTLTSCLLGAFVSFGMMILITAFLAASNGARMSSGASFQPTQMAADSAGGSGNIGLSVGGANDADNFRENIDNCYLPAPTDITYEGLFYDYYFDTANMTECTGVFCPQYETAVTDDPFSGEDEHYLSVGLGSNISQAEFERPPLNLVIVLDVSGSMSSTFDRYYYDRFRNKSQVDLSDINWEKQKMEVAKEAISGVVDQLRPEDRIGLVTFESSARTLAKPKKISERPTRAVTNIVNRMSPGGGTNMEAGIKEGTQLLKDLRDKQRGDRENRVIFLTDAQPNTGNLEQSELYQQAKRNAEDGLHTTFFGIGVDFNTKLIEAITNNLRGANYFAVHSPEDFNKRLNEEFEYFSAPLAYDVTLSVDSGDYEIQKIYGSPEDDQSTDELLKVKTLFPSPTEEGQSRGGVVLAEMDKDGTSNQPVTLTASYETRSGENASNTQTVQWTNTEPSENMQKAILLSRFAKLMKNWLADEHLRRGEPEKTVYIPVSDAVRHYRDEGLMPLESRRPSRRDTQYIEQELSRWERLSRRLAVSEDYKETMRDFLDHFNSVADNISDDSLDREREILENLLNAPTPDKISEDSDNYNPSY